MNLEELINITKSILEDGLDDDPRIQSIKGFVKDLTDDEKINFKSVVSDFSESLKIKDNKIISERYKNKNSKSISKMSDEDFWSLIE